MPHAKISTIVMTYRITVPQTCHQLGDADADDEAADDQRGGEADGAGASTTRTAGS